MKLEEVQGLFAKISNLLFEFELAYFKTAKMSYLKLLLLLLLLFVLFFRNRFTRNWYATFL